MNKIRMEDYTEQEFLTLLKEIYAVDGIIPDNHDELIYIFNQSAAHPEGSDLIFYPSDGVEKTPDQVLQIIKSWRASTGLPGFKGEES